jgi:uncharacterized protein YyaL (SSP411 family)
MADKSDITVRPDAKGRIALGALAKGISSYRVHKEEGGRLVLEPFTEIPLREQWRYKNPQALEAVKQGLKDSAAGRIYDLGDFTQYANDEE